MAPRDNEAVTDALAPEAVFSFPALWSAAARAARGKRHRPGVARFRLDLEAELLALRRELLSGDWRPGPQRRLVIHDPKPRVISVPPFRDRVVHQALAAVLGPKVERRMIRDSYASRVDAGTHAALRRARAWSRTYAWHVRLDVAQFFPGVDHAIVREHLAEDVPHGGLRAVCEAILRAGGGPRHRAYFPGDDLFTPYERDVGLPLGNLTSQLWANRFLDPVDHLVKDRLRVRAYLRYMDDMLLLHDDRATLEALARAMEEACHALHLRLHPWEVQPTRAGVGFVGYRILPDHVRVRRTTVARAERRLARGARELQAGGNVEGFRDGLTATFAHWDHADAWHLKERVLRRLGLLYEPGAP